MPDSFSILPHRGLVYIRHFGHLKIADAVAGFAEYRSHPDFAPKQNALIDFEEVLSFEVDHLLMMKFQAEIASRLPVAEFPSLLVLFAPPNTPGRALATSVNKSWEGLGLRITRITETEAEALDILGQPERSFADLLAPAT